MSDGSTHPGVLPTRMHSSRRSPRQILRAAGSYAKEPMFSTLFTKFTRALFHQVTEFAFTTLSFSFFTVAKSPGTRARIGTMALAPGGYAGEPSPSPP